jgi:2,4-dienoyl-CoA reductase-like NADH-dependent reductase (Old Yellow Enzyme family)/NADPH-dependent 2,4-dienoyl-CoA reductase/sulfur reductase-like enzyme
VKIPFGLSLGKFMSPFSILFSPFKIGSLKLKNRVVLPPMGTCLGDINGVVTKKLVDYYIERAKGGVGLIIVENTLVTSRFGIQIANQLRIDSYHHVPYLFELTEAVKEHGARIAIQINVPGCGTRRHLAPTVKPTGPSARAYDFQPERCKILSVKEIKEIVNDFARGAKLAKQAGFDAIEIHGANGYLINQFLSPYSNRRKDAYGGDLRKRLKFCIEVIQGVREVVGDDYPLLFRLGIDEFLDGGFTVEQAVEVAKSAEQAGINALDVTAGNLNMRKSCARAIPSLFIPDGHLAEDAGKVKKALDIPVILAGKIRDPQLAEEILRKEKADLIAIGRGFLSDSQWALKAMTGKHKEIRKCISCNEMCLYHKTWLSRPIRCTVNPLVGRENRRIDKVAKPKRVLVIGGGPAGMEAARVSALRGHIVTVCEKASRLGGQLWIASVLPYKKEMRELIEQMSTQLEQLGVSIRLNEKVTAESLKNMPFDVIVVATGAKPLKPSLPGIEHHRVLYYDDVLSDKKNAKGENIIVGGGGVIGCETAIYIAENKGKRVTIVEKMDQAASEMEPIFNRDGLLQRLEKNGIRILLDHEILGIEDRIVRIGQKKVSKTLPMDTLVLALGRSQNDKLFKQLTGSGTSVNFVGDCIEPRKLSNAIHEGFWAGIKIQ